MLFILVSCGAQKQYDYSWVSTLEDGQQEIQPANITVTNLEETESFDEPGE